MIVPGKDGQIQQTIDMSQTTQIKCDSCENSTFKQTLIMRKMSALVSPNGQETVIPIGVFAVPLSSEIVPLLAILPLNVIKAGSPAAGPVAQEILLVTT